MATKAAAMPQLVRRNCRRFKPSRAAFASASSTMRRSTFFWVALCLGGRYSPLETIWVGIGVAAEASSAPATRRCSRSLSQLPIGFLRLVEQREEPIGACLWARAVGQGDDGLLEKVSPGKLVMPLPRLHARESRGRRAASSSAAPAYLLSYSQRRTRCR